MTKLNKRKILTTVVLLVFTFCLKAQNKVITGKVTTYKTISIKNAKVSLKKSENIAFTDSLGYFTIMGSLKDKITIKAEGFKTKTVKLKNYKDSMRINIEVAGEENDLNLAFANGHINRKNLTQARIYYNTVEPYSLGYTNIIELLKGKFPNASVSNDKVIIRGANTISKTTSNAALIVLNGVLTNMDAIKLVNIIEIKNIKILTGGAAFRYGAGSGNGVIAVEMLTM